MTETLAPSAATIFVYEEMVPVCVARLEKLAAKATKLGCSISWEVGASEPRKSCDPATGLVKFIYLVRPVTVTGSAPRLAGWSFIGMLSRSDAAGTLRKMVPGFSCPDSAKDATPERCDHCHKARRRDSSFIVQHTDGRVNVVGSSCLRDFLGHKSPEQVVNGCNWLVDLVDGLDDDFGASGGGAKPYFTTLEVLRVAFHLAANGGYKPAKFENKSTASEVFATLCPPMQARAAADKLLAEITEATTERARAAIEWVLGTTEDSDFMSILHIHSYETQFGWQCIYLFLLADGNIAKWNTGSYIDNAGKGSKVIIKKATIKAHEEYQGTAQTVLTRVEVEVVPEAEVAAALVS